MIAAFVLTLTLMTPAEFSADFDQMCEDETDVTELADLSPTCRAWLYEDDAHRFDGDACAETDAGCPALISPTTKE